MKKGDRIIILLVFVVAVVAFFFMRVNTDKYYVEIQYNGETVEYFELTDDLDLTLELEYEGYNKLVIHDGHVDMVEADCPDQDCVHMQAITYDSWNPTIICAPNKIVVRIVGGNSEVDGIV